MSSISKNSQGTKIWKKYGGYYLMVIPFMLLFTLFTVVPVVISLPIAFTNFNMVEMPTFVGFENFKRLILEDEVFLIAVKNTMIFAVVTGPISYFLCLFMAWLINDYPKYLRAFLTIIFYAPSMTSSAFVVWNYIFSGDMYGFLNSILMNTGIISDPIQWLTDARYTMPVVIVVQLWLSLGAGFLSFIAGLQNVDKAMYEVGAIEGIRNRWQELFYITLPTMGPQLLFGAVMQISSSFAAGAVSMQLTGFPSTDYSTHTIVLHAQDYGFTRYEMGYASAICFILFLIMLVVNEIIRVVLRNYTD